MGPGPDVGLSAQGGGARAGPGGPRLPRVRRAGPCRARGLGRRAPPPARGDVRALRGGADRAASVGGGWAARSGGRHRGRSGVGTAGWAHQPGARP